MWDSIVNTKFYYLRVNHKKLDLIRIRLVQNTHNDRIDTDGFTGPGRTGDQKMRHLGNIRHLRSSRYVFTDCKADLRLGFFKFF